MGAFGERLRKQREQRGITLEAICGVTKISVRMLRAIEEEKFDQLPGGVFNKGFVRAYARQVGLDEEEALSDYLDALQESQIQEQNILPDLRASHLSGGEAIRTVELSAGAAAKDLPNESQLRTSIVAADAHHQDPENSREAISFRPAARFSWGILVAIVAVVCAGIGYWSVHSRNLPSEASRPEAGSGDQGVASTSAESHTGPPATNTESSAGRTAAKTPPSINHAVTNSGPNSGSEADIKGTKRDFRSTFATNQPKFTLLIRAEKTSWVSITVDGKLVAEEIITAPAEVTTHASDKIVVKTGNAAGIGFVFDGKELPANGKDGEVRTFTFDRSGIAPSPSAAIPDTRN